MSKLIPHFYLNGAAEATPEFLKGLGVRALLLDVDNTIAFDNSQKTTPEITSWLADLKKAGIRAAIFSNNHEPRVKCFAESVCLPFVCEAKKPLTGKLKEALDAVDSDEQHTAVVGDQLFTDVLFARRAGLFAILVKPMGPDVFRFVRFKRLLERPVMCFIEKKERK